MAALGMMGGGTAAVLDAPNIAARTSLTAAAAAGGGRTGGTAGGRMAAD